MKKIATIAAYLSSQTIDELEKITSKGIVYIKDVDTQFKKNPELVTPEIEKKAFLLLKNRNKNRNYEEMCENVMLSMTMNDYNIIFNRDNDFILKENKLYSKIEYKEEKSVQQKENKKLLEKIQNEKKIISEKENNLIKNFDQLNKRAELLGQKEKELDKKEKRINFMMQFYSNMTKQLDEYANLHAEFKKKYTFTLMFGGLTPKQFETVCNSTVKLADKFRAKNEKQRQKENQKINEITKTRGR